MIGTADLKKCAKAVRLVVQHGICSYPMVESRLHYCNHCVAQERGHTLVYRQFFAFQSFVLCYKLFTTQVTALR